MPEASLARVTLVELVLDQLTLLEKPLVADADLVLDLLELCFQLERERGRVSRAGRKLVQA
jgi:hypothetical protein